jgi:hypothetical protein
MSLLSTSNSNRTWRRISGDVLWVVAILLVLEVIVRLPPVQQYLENRLHTYENLFWHDPNMPRYAQDLSANPDYTFWLVGSSYMMTAINPSIVQDGMAAEPPITMQNFGMTVMTNLSFMAEMMERWMLRLDEPQYMVLFVGEGNFSNPYLAQARDGIYERTFLFPDSISDYAGGFLYKHSQLYRYLLLARNVPVVTYEDTLREPRPNGGYTLYPDEAYACPDRVDSSPRVSSQLPPVGFNNLRRFIAMTKQYEIPLLIISLPLPECARQLRYVDFADYQEAYLLPVAALAEEAGIAFYELDTRFEENIPITEQHLYFRDATHANRRGAELLSQWTTDILNQWFTDMNSD